MQRKGFSLQKIRQQIENYKKFIVSKNYDEIYKWQSLKNFQDNWNIEAEDFKTMYNNSFNNSISNNLWSNRFWFPKDAMMKLIEYDKEIVRKMFTDLFNENENIDKRVDKFVYHCDQLRDEIIKTDTSFKNHFHDGQRIISLYLAFKFPDKYAIYKYTEFKTFMQIVDATDIPGTGEIERFFKIVRTLFNIISQDNEMIDTHKKLLDENCYKNQTLMLAQDFIFCSARQYM